jgi:hypothetical protein
MANVSSLNDPRDQIILITGEPTALFSSQWLTLIISLRMSTWVESDEKSTVQFSETALVILPSRCPKTPLLLDMMRFL